MSAYKAKECFDENLRLFTDPKTHPEQYNLYSGLSCLASSVISLQGELEQLRAEIRQLSLRIK